MLAPRRAIASIATAMMMLAIASGFGVLTPVSAQSAQSVTIDLLEENGSGVAGSAKLTENGNKTTVRLELNGPVGSNPANILAGDCAVNDPTPAYTLKDVDAKGISETSIDTPLDALLADPYVIVVHASATNLGTIVACGEIVETAAPTPTKAATATATAAGLTEALISLEMANESGVSGSATLKANGSGKTDVTISVDGVLGTNLAAIFTGSCVNLGEKPAYQLSSVDENGKSSTTVNVPLTTLVNQSHALLVYDPEIPLGQGSALACGDIVGAIGGATSGPATGAGVLAGTPVKGGMIALFLLAGMMTLAGGLTLRGARR